MLRGTVVRVNDKEFRGGLRGKMIHLRRGLVGKSGIALERMKDSGYIKVLQEYEGHLVDCCYPEHTLDIVEPPVEL